MFCLKVSGKSHIASIGLSVATITIHVKWTLGDNCCMQSFMQSQAPTHIEAGLSRYSTHMIVILKAGASYLQLPATSSIWYTIII